MIGQSLAFSRRTSSASTASRMNSPRLFGPISASMRAITASESRTVVSFTPSAGRPMRRVVSDSCKSDKPIAFMLTDVTDSSYVTAIAYGNNPMTFQLDMAGTVAIPGDPALARNNDAMECLDCGRDNTGHEGEPCCDDCPSQSRQWEDLDAFTQGYVEAMFASVGGFEAIRADDLAWPGKTSFLGFSDLAPETLARIIADCEAAQSRYSFTTTPKEDGAAEWRGDQNSIHCRKTVQLGDDGKVRFA